MSEVTLTIRVKVNLLGLREFYESETKAREAVLEALATSHKIKEILLVRVDSVSADGAHPKLEVKE